MPFWGKNRYLKELFLWQQQYCFGAQTPTVTLLSRKSTKQGSLSIVLRTVEEHIPDSSREWSIVLLLRLKRQWQTRKGHRRQFKLSQFVSMVTPRFEKLPWFFQSDLVLTRCYDLSLSIDNTSQWWGLIGIIMSYWNFKISWEMCL